MKTPRCDIPPLSREYLVAATAQANASTPKDRATLALLLDIYRMQFLLIKAHQIVRVIRSKGYNTRTLDSLAEGLFELLEKDPCIQKENADRANSLRRPPK